MPAKINLEFSGYWPASGMLGLSFKGIEKEKEREEQERERERRRKRKRGETWEQRPD